MAIETYHKVTYAAATTGEQDMVEVTHNHVSTVGVVVGAGTTANFDIDVQLKSGATETRHVHTAAATASTLVHLPHAVQAIGLDIDTNTGGAGITLEIRTSARG